MVEKSFSGSLNLRQELITQMRGSILIERRALVEFASRSRMELDSHRFIAFNRARASAKTSSAGINSDLVELLAAHSSDD